VFSSLWHITEKWLVKCPESLATIGFEESLVKSVSLNFFCIMKVLKKEMLGLRKSGRNSVGI
jgi:hypothetical protein